MSFNGHLKFEKTRQSKVKKEKTNLSKRTTKIKLIKQFILNTTHHVRYTETVFVILYTNT